MSKLSVQSINAQLEKDGEDYEILEYTDYFALAKFKHKSKGCIFETNYNNFARGYKCPCTFKKNRTDGMWIEHFYKFFSDEDYTCIGIDRTYPHIHYLVECKMCGAIFLTDATTCYDYSALCKNCTYISRELSAKKEITRWFNEHATNLTLHDITWHLTGIYNNKHQTKPFLTYTCDICGESYTRDYYNIQSAYYKETITKDNVFQCKCQGRRSKKYWADQFAESATSNDFEFINITPGVYCDKFMMYYELKCKHCGEIISRPADQVFHGIVCQCQKRGAGVSYGESRIMNILDENNVSYQREYTFPDCKNVTYLRFDFAVFDNNNLKCLIEFDGEQHFQIVEAWGGEDGFKIRQENDSIKNKYCNDNNLKLIRIPYREYDNIEKILRDNNII